MNPGNITASNHLEMNNWTGDGSTSARGANWTKHMTIWNCNYKADKNPTDDTDNILDQHMDMSTQLFIDKVEFKDFNYEHHNPNMNTRNTYPDKIEVSAGEAFGWTSGNTTLATDKLSRYKTFTPTTLTVGSTTPRYLGHIDNDRADIGYLPWSHDDAASFIYLHGFKTSNLAQLSEIPNENMHAFYSFGGGAESDGNSGTLKDKFGYNNNTVYASQGFRGVADANDGTKTPPVMRVNNWLTGDVNQRNNSNFNLNCVSTQMTAVEVHNSSTNSSGDLNLDPGVGGNDNYTGKFTRIFQPVREGDTLLWPGSDSLSLTNRYQTQYTATAGDVDIRSGHENDIAIAGISFSDSIPIAIDDEFWVKPEGMCHNFTKKGWFSINPTFYQSSTYNNVEDDEGNQQLARREAGPVSSRVIDITESKEHECIIKVDTLAPLQLEEDEEYIVYLLGSDADSDNWTANATYDGAADMDASAVNAKSGVKITEIDEQTNEITLEWDGTANDGSTQLLKYDNLSFLCISPYRYWMYLNIDCAKHGGSGATYPTTTLPSRTYEAFTVMDHAFVTWDGESYHSGLLDEPLNTTEEDITVTSSTGMSAGDVIMIEDEAMIIMEVTSSTVIKVIRNIGANDQSTHNGFDTDSTYYPKRTAPATISTGKKIKKCVAHAVDGEVLEASWIDGTNAYDSLSERRNLGSTYKEFTTNHETVSNVPGAYINTWKPTVLEEGGIYETETDFGFGPFDDEEDKGGQLANQIIKSASYNIFKLQNISASKDFQVGRQIDLLTKFTDDTNPHEFTVNTRHHADTDRRPFALAVFEDKIPSVPSLTIAPYKDDPYFPELSWKVNDDDLWYGLIHVDTSPIDNQYHNAVAHIPMNEEHYTTGVTNPQAFTKLTKEDGSTALASSGTASVSLEGLAGRALEFDGTSNGVTFADFTPITSEGTVIVHIVPEAWHSPTVHGSGHGGATIIRKAKGGGSATFSGSDWEIYLKSDGTIEGFFTPSGTSTKVTVTSQPIVMDGETPTAIAMTFDKDIKSGNVKLFINGKLEDQSGLIKATATTNNWLINTDARDDSAALGIGFFGTTDGAEGTTGTAAYQRYKGKIEEAVIYNKCLYPVVPADGKLLLTKPFTEISNGSPLSYSAKLFVKDYHNIRGKTTAEVATSAPATFRKSGFDLHD